MDVAAEHLDREQDVTAGPNGDGPGVTGEHPPSLWKWREHLPPQHHVLPAPEGTHCSSQLWMGQGRGMDHPCFKAWKGRALTDPNSQTKPVQSKSWAEKQTT